MSYIWGDFGLCRLMVVLCVVFGMSLRASEFWFFGVFLVVAGFLGSREFWCLGYIEENNSNTREEYSVGG